MDDSNTGESYSSPWVYGKTWGGNSAIQEQRMRREFLYYIYSNAQYSNQSGSGNDEMNSADSLLVYQSMDLNWNLRGNEGFAPLVRYHLEEGNITVSLDATLEDTQKLLANNMWRFPSGVFFKRLYITSQGKNAIENDQELLSCLDLWGIQVDWGKADTIREDKTSKTPADETQRKAKIAKQYGIRHKTVPVWEGIKELLTAGLSQVQIASQLDLDERTIRGHIKKMRDKGYLTPEYFPK